MIQNLLGMLKRYIEKTNFMFDIFRSQYCRNNFNDYLSSLILLFELTVVNQWHGKKN